MKKKNKKTKSKHKTKKKIFKIYFIIYHFDFKMISGRLILNIKIIKVKKNIKITLKKKNFH